MKYRNRLWNDLNNLLAMLEGINQHGVIENFYSAYGNDAPAALLKEQIAKLQSHLNKAKGCPKGLVRFHTKGEVVLPKVKSLWPKLDCTIEHCDSSTKPKEKSMKSNMTTTEFKNCIPDAHSITEFVYRKKQRVGVLLAVKINGTVYVAGSKTNLTLGDKFDRERALSIAWDRVQVSRSGRQTKLAASFGDELLQFKNRCLRFFRTNDIVMPECGDLFRN